MTTKTIEISDLTLKDLAKFVKSEPVIVMDKKDPVYAVIPLDEEDYESWLLSENPKFMEIIERSRKQFREKGGIPIEEVEQELGLDVD